MQFIEGWVWAGLRQAAIAMGRFQNKDKDKAATHTTSSDTVSEPGVCITRFMLDASDGYWDTTAIVQLRLYHEYLNSP